MSQNKDARSSGGEEQQIKLEGLSSGARSALHNAVCNVPADVSIKTDVTLGRVDEDALDDLLKSISEYEQEMSEYSAHDKAQSADRLYRLLEKEARRVGLFD